MVFKISLIFVMYNESNSTDVIVSAMGAIEFLSFHFLSGFYKIVLKGMLKTLRINESKRSHYPSMPKTNFDIEEMHACI